ncbi:hypothetical protein [Nocardia sp. alder85J]|uniref:hypothetical protein n=1 Tax=Nocardia sp. alder85J TaxID=2862949 RepID=UPI001CD4F925|nr:hypothetical protein [Nocardia sp. alder85J]MCX4092182.1 hypothetical protein [Nocardia sp. alder85J]
MTSPLSGIPLQLAEAVLGPRPQAHIGEWRRVGDAWSEAGDRLKGLAAEIAALADRLPASGSGATVSAISDTLHRTSATAGQQGAFSDSLAAQNYEGANTVEAGQFTWDGMAVVTVAQLAADAALLQAGAVKEAADRAAARAGWRQSLFRLLDRLAGTGLTYRTSRAGMLLHAGLLGGGINTLVTVGAELRQTAAGHRHGLDARAVITAAVSGVAGGIGGSFLAHRAAPALSRFTTTRFGPRAALLAPLLLGGVGGLGGAAAGSAAGALTDYGYTGTWSLPWDAQARGGLIAGIVGGALGGTVHAVHNGFAALRDPAGGTAPELPERLGTMPAVDGRADPVGNPGTEPDTPGRRVVRGGPVDSHSAAGTSARPDAHPGAFTEGPGAARIRRGGRDPGTVYAYDPELGPEAQAHRPPGSGEPAPGSGENHGREAEAAGLPDGHDAAARTPSHDDVGPTETRSATVEVPPGAARDSAEAVRARIDELRQRHLTWSVEGAQRASAGDRMFNSDRFDTATKQIIAELDRLHATGRIVDDLQLPVAASADARRARESVFQPDRAFREALDNARNDLGSYLYDRAILGGNEVFDAETQLTLARREIETATELVRAAVANAGEITELASMSALFSWADRVGIDGHVRPELIDPGDPHGGGLPDPAHLELLPASVPAARPHSWEDSVDPELYRAVHESVARRRAAGQPGVHVRALDHRIVHEIPDDAPSNRSTRCGCRTAGRSTCGCSATRTATRC